MGMSVADHENGAGYMKALNLKAKGYEAIRDHFLETHPNWPSEEYKEGFCSVYYPMVIKHSKCNQESNL